MTQLKELVKTADWKTEKHVPVIESPEAAKKGQSTAINVSVGKEIAHPNTTEHHISWIALYFLPKDEKFAYEIGKFEFNAHGSSTQGPNTSTVYTDAKVTAYLKTDKPGVLLASSYCNIHGLWEGQMKLELTG